MIHYIFWNNEKNFEFGESWPKFEIREYCPPLLGTQGESLESLKIFRTVKELDIYIIFKHNITKYIKRWEHSEISTPAIGNLAFGITWFLFGGEVGGRCAENFDFLVSIFPNVPKVPKETNAVKESRNVFCFEDEMLWNWFRLQPVTKFCLQFKLVRRRRIFTAFNRNHQQQLTSEQVHQS